jgi:hypothetical protein
MSNFKYTAGLNHVGSYQVSGAPFLTSSVDATQAVKVEFPYVTSWVVIQNNAHANTEHLKVGFSQNGVEGTNYFWLYDRYNNSSQDRSSILPPLKLKLTEIWLSGSSNVEVIAGLTNIPVERINNISPSGSNWSGSIGVG